MSRPNFARDLKVGQAGERAFIKLAAQHGIDLLQTDGRSGDLVDSTGGIWELKTDSYDHEATANFFIELYSDVDKGKLGGPAQALANGCQYFVYYFSANNIAYIFHTENLCRQVDNYIAMNSPKHVEIRNRSWVTLGIKVPRSSLVPVRVLSKKPVPPNG